MKCLFVINDLARAGAEKQVSLLALGLKELGWSVAVALVKERNDFEASLRAAAIPVIPLNRRGPFDLGVVSRLRRVIRDESPHVVVSFLFLANLLTILATRALRGRPPVAVSVRASYVSTLTLSQRLAARVSHRGAELIIFNSKRVLREEQEGFPRAVRTAHLPNAVAAQRADPVRWADWGVAPGAVVLSVGQLTQVKGHRLLIEAFALVAETHPSARLVLIGDGPEESSLRALVQKTGLDGRVTLLGHQEEPLPFMAGADVFVQPSLSEGMSNALMEAMMLGLCIVSTQAGAPPGVLEDGAGALLVPATAKDLAGAISRALGDQALRSRLGAESRKVAESFSIDRVAPELDAMLQRVILGFKGSLPPPR